MAITLNNFASDNATTYTAEILENPTYDSNKGAAYFKARMNGKDVVRLSMSGGTLIAFLERADGKAPRKADGNGYDFRGVKVAGHGKVNPAKDGIGKFLNMYYILGVEAKAAPAPKAEVENTAKAEAPAGMVAVAAHTRRAPKRK